MLTLALTMLLHLYLILTSYFEMAGADLKLV